ncbi:uncharacterized protein M421DRAFT_101768 [Didymella exigua CBS 183.55]|uniref:Heterokaryon incompatibility domain-containing protein n=1 Tax=Didymella exigua CBS 183.55 TaxID=1150837 RepID=A0A6A5RGA9_9PLEO|nr:uncharacterized protein M421DRAFT_101768 [Didymella exigua CBS 183.55]KAF1927351.1 hypothetical protein M421DRAFT_101768 [Didymella exigua CBS 183.55]
MQAAGQSSAVRSSAREIRLLDLLPGEQDDPIRCTTRVVSLDDHPDFESVSYVWGDRKEERGIEVSGTCIPITKNLHSGLLRLRHARVGRTLWIDQICINQWDLEEKAAQVALMRDIYRQCTQCVTWMGELTREGHDVPVHDAQAVFDFLRRVAAAKTTPLSDLPVLFEPSDRGSAARSAFERFSIAIPNAQSCDYTISASHLFAKVTLDLIRHERGLRPLLGACEMPQQSPGIPSWAIDFACVNRIGKRQLRWWGHSHRYRVFSACGEHSLTLSDAADVQVLGLKGVHVDQVVDTVALLRVSPQDPIHSLELREPLANCIQLLTQFRASEAAPAVYKDGFTWESALCRTLVGDLIVDELPLDSIARYGRARLEADFDALSYKPEPGAFTNLRESLMGMMENQTFFLTKSGYMGIGPPQTTSGDQVWVFHGGNVPFVMRGVEAEGGLSRRLALVGDAYVQGIMDGESMRDDPYLQHVDVC